MFGARDRGSYAALAFLAGVGFGCPVEPLFTGIPAFQGDIALVKDKPISGEAILVSLLVEPPDPGLSFPEEPLPGGNEEPRTPDIHLSLKANYSAAGVLGSRALGDFVPYLIVNVTITNLDNNETFRSRLIPEVSFAGSYGYGRNVALLETLGLSELGYLVTVRVEPPALTGDPSAVAEGAGALAQAKGTSVLSPGISVGLDLSPFLQGTVFTVHAIGDRQGDATTIVGAFTLADFQAAEDAGSETGGTGSVPTYTY